MQAKNTELASRASDMEAQVELAARRNLPRITRNIPDDNQPTLCWFRMRIDAKGYPQMWVSMKDKKALLKGIFVRSYIDENGEDKEEIYDIYNLKELNEAIRYRTLTREGTYGVAILNSDEIYYHSGTLITLEDFDGNGIIDHMTDNSGKVTALDIEGAFAVN